MEELLDEKNRNGADPHIQCVPLRGRGEVLGSRAWLCPAGKESLGSTQICRMDRRDDQSSHRDQLVRERKLDRYVHEERGNPEDGLQQHHGSKRNCAAAANLVICTIHGMS